MEDARCSGERLKGSLLHPKKEFSLCMTMRVSTSTSTSTSREHDTGTDKNESITGFNSDDDYIESGK
jgi:hypothetical protein